MHNLVWDEVTREQLGTIIVGLTAILLAMNMGVIVFVSIKGLCRNLKLRSLKKKSLADALKLREKQKNKNDILKIKD